MADRHLIQFEADRLESIGEAAVELANYMRKLPRNGEHNKQISYAEVYRLRRRLSRVVASLGAGDVPPTDAEKRLRELEEKRRTAARTAVSDD